MTTTAASEIGSPTDPDRRPRSSSHRRRWVLLGVLVVIAGVVAGLLRYAATYQPLRGGDGAITSIGAATSISDGFSTQTGLMLTGRTGSQGGQVLSLENDGRFGVKLLASDGFLHYSWLPASEFGSSRAKMLSLARPLPVTVKPGAGIYIFVMATKPNCHRGSGLFYSGPEIETESLGFHHWYVFPTGEDGDSVPFYLCPTNKQVANAITN